LLATQPLAALRVLCLRGAAITGIVRVVSLKGVAITRIARVIATSLAILIASVATTSFILLLLVLLFNFAISSIMQTDAQSLLSL
jgi:hypothetical protein